MSFGLLDTGFVRKTLQEIRQEMNIELWEEFGYSLDLSDRSPLGVLIGVIAESISKTWEQLESVHASFDPDNATGVALEQRAALTNTVRALPKQSTVEAWCTGDAGTIISDGSIIRVSGTENRFVIPTGGTLVAATPFVISTTYLIDDVVTYDDGIYICFSAGVATSVPAPGIQGTVLGQSTTSSAAVWRYVGEGDAYLVLDAVSENFDAVIATNGTLTEVVTTTTGWDGVNNMVDALPGFISEPDATLRLRRLIELAGVGTSTRDAVRAALIRLENVVSVEANWNVTSLTDANGVPPNSVRFMIIGGDDSEIIQTLSETMSGGIQTIGSVSGTVEDGEGKNQTYSFSRPADTNMYVSLNVQYDVGEYPVNGDELVAKAIVAYGEALPIGRDITSSAVKSACFSVPGVFDVTYAYIDTSPLPTTETKVVIDPAYKGKFAVERIVITSEEGSL